MQQQPQQPTPITDEEIIDFSRAYDATGPARRKNTEDYLRDGTYYTNGYVRLRMKGLTHEQARDIFLSTAERDAYYDVDISVPGLPWLGDDEIIDVSARFISRYRAIGRFQPLARQSWPREQRSTRTAESLPSCRTMRTVSALMPSPGV